MDAMHLLDRCRVVPVVVIEAADVALPLAETLYEAGLSVIEVTLRTDDALAAIETIAKNVPELIVGAGSIRRPGQFAAVRNAGARFAVSPGASSALLDAAQELDMPFVPGAATPSEMIRLFEQGYRLQKFFPAEQAGGCAFLKSVGAPLPEVSFMPTGGITPDNAARYLALANVNCVGGSWITPARLQAERDFAAIRGLATDAARIAV